MAEVFLCGFLKLLASRGRTLRPKAALPWVITSGLLTACVFAQQPSSQPSKGAQPNSTTTSTAPPPPAQIWLPPLQNPEHRPVIDWDGKLLTIDADNSSLSDIMLAIRSRTGASIEMPGSANRERIAVHLGPAPIREVLSSLLYGTDFNYVIQSSEDDETALGKVILIPRDAGDQSEAIVADDSRPKSRVRLMPGYAAPGKRDFEVAHANAVDENSSSVADAPAADLPASADQPASAADSTATNATAETQPATSETADSASPSDADPNALSASGQLTSTGTVATAPANGSGASATGGGSSIGEMEQNLQRLYQQRQQLQARQNRPAPQPNTP